MTLMVTTIWINDSLVKTVNNKSNWTYLSHSFKLIVNFFSFSQYAISICFTAFQSLRQTFGIHNYRFQWWRWHYFHVTTQNHWDLFLNVLFLFIYCFFLFYLQEYTEHSHKTVQTGIVKLIVKTISKTNWNWFLCNDSLHKQIDELSTNEHLLKIQLNRIFYSVCFCSFFLRLRPNSFIVGFQ